MQQAGRGRWMVLSLARPAGYRLDSHAAPRPAADAAVLDGWLERLELMRLPAFFLLSAALSCATPRPPAAGGNAVIASCSGASGGWSTDSSLVPYPQIAPFPQCWYSAFLRVLGEPALRDLDTADAAYRLLILPTWAPAKVVRLSQVGGVIHLRVAQTLGPGGYDPRGEAWHRDTVLAIEDWRHAQALMGSPTFWHIPDRAIAGEDGTQWVLEARMPGAASVLEMWEPSLGGPWAQQRRAAEHLLALAQLSVSE